ncbi:MAG TPA: alpha/beta hydrolase [Gaiellaceae bacterium]|nr:alpha/beta hydrolase [Gaiellaceae bacterium]
MLLAATVFDAVTTSHSVPAQKLWHGKFVRADGVLTAYRSWGTHGTPIVLVGGFFEPSFVWDDVGPLLARTHRVYAFDLDGFGYTQPHGPWTLAEWTGQLRGFDEALHLGKPVVVGHSLGAAVAVQAAAQGLASRAVLLDGDALKINGPPRFVRWAILHSPLFTAALRLATRWSWPVKRIVANAFGPGPHPRVPVHAWTDPLRVQGAEAALRGMLIHGVAGLDRSTLQRARIRATVAFGANDSVDSPAAGRQTAHDLHARFVLIPDAGHLSMLGNPRAVAAAILR